MYFDTFYIQWHRLTKKDIWNEMYMVMIMIMKIGLPQPRDLGVIHYNQLQTYHYSQNAHLFLDDFAPWVQFVNGYDIDMLG
jgi:hypothetical protein